MSEQELLRQYIEEGSNEAFAEIVRRHVNLVYSVARRIVISPAAAQDVTQSAFVALAQNAARLKPSTPLVAWLHLVSRRLAIDFVRRESRRQTRETQATEIAAMDASPSEWSAIEPLLDEAVESLGTADRTAILLRYFENKSLREVGEALGTSEDNAQKRVSRTLERLRKFFAARGVTITASGLITTLSTHAIETAPATLSVAISNVALISGTLLHSATAPTLFLSIAMTSLQKTLVTTVLAAAVVGALYEIHAFTRQNRELTSLREQVAQLEGRNQDLQQQIVAAKAVPVAKIPPTPAISQERQAADAFIEALVDRLMLFKQRVGEMKERQIPEMQYLADEDWLEALNKADLNTELGVRKALSQLRNRAKSYFAEKVQAGLGEYLKANDGRMPTEMMQLAPYFHPPVDQAILQRYELPAVQPPDSPPMYKISEVPIWEKAPVDDYYDALARFGTKFTMMQGVSAKGNAVSAAIKEFRASHGGAVPSAEEIAPYLKADIDPAYLKEALTRAAKQ
jgi:RNA polymerase sigma factor (sigma-70 family)